MLLVNLDVKKKLVNGLRGTIVAIGPQQPPQNQPPPPAPEDATTTSRDDDKKSNDGELTAAEKAEILAWKRRLQRENDDSDDDDMTVFDAENVDEVARILDPVEETIWVRFERHAELVAITRYRWKHCLKDSERHLPEDQWTEYVQISQFPLALAYASTIHKTQSLALSAAVLSLGEEVARTPGQAYTALSRVESIEGLNILKLSPKACFADPTIKAYYLLLQKNSPP